MKKVCSLICLIFVLLSMVQPAGAEEYHEDSVTIPEEVLACLDMGNIDTVFCVYNFEDQFLRCYYELFDRYGDIDGVLANAKEPELQRYYFVKDQSGKMSAYTYDGISLSQGHMWGAGWFEMHSEEADRIIKKIDAGIVVEHIYYLLFYNWSAVCYKTNLGNYVYVRSNKKDYLMDQEAFMVLQGELKAMAIKFRDWRNMINEPYHIKLDKLSVDLSPYDMDAQDFDPHAPLDVHHNYKPGKLIAISSFVLLIALIVGRFLIRGHRKYREKKERMATRI